MMIHDNRQCRLGEGAFWHPERQQFFWFDIKGKRLLSQQADGSPLSWQPAFESFAVFLIWFAAVITVWTGWQYFSEARRQMSGA